MHFNSRSSPFQRLGVEMTAIAPAPLRLPSSPARERSFQRNCGMRVSGTVKFYNADKAYGFLIPANGGDDVFVHLKDLKAKGIRSLAQDQKVTFEIVEGRDGKPKAANVEIDQ